MALPEVMIVTVEDFEKWAAEFRRWGQACEQKGDMDEFAKKSYVIASLMDKARVEIVGNGTVAVVRKS
jgi:hypothetical protein